MRRTDWETAQLLVPRREYELEFDFELDLGGLPQGERANSEPLGHTREAARPREQHRGWQQQQQPAGGRARDEYRFEGR